MPGAGVGGPCLPKDPYLLLYSVKKDTFESNIIKLARNLNETMPNHIVELILEGLYFLGKTLNKSKIAILGVAYKGDIDDSRLSPSEKVINSLISQGADVVVYDPYCNETFGAKRAKSLEASLKGSDCAVFMTDHTIFREIDLSKVKECMNSPAVIVDGRRVINPEEAEALGFRYYGVGYGKRGR